MNVPSEPFLAGALLLALVVDLVWGDPPNRFHPVAWFGQLVDPARTRAERGPAWIQLAIGGVVSVVAPAVFAGAGVLVVWMCGAVPLLQLCICVFVLKASFAIAGLGAAGAAVERALERGDLQEARRCLGSLCSRDASELDAESVAAAAVESIAENASDSVVAPMFYLALFGLPGALAYRAVNTLDAMIGYRGRYEYLGKAAARLDDLLNWIPARLCAGLLLCAGGLLGHRVANGWSVLLRDGATTPSPNAGRPMASMAGLLGVRLCKPGVYALGDAHRPVEASDIGRAWCIARSSAIVAAVLTAGVLWSTGR